MRQREFVFTDQDFERIRSLIYTHAGISLSLTKRDMVYSRLARRLRANGMTSFQVYLDALMEDGAEWEEFVNALTTNLTAFFRESHHFPVLAEYLVSARARIERPLRIWSAGCSTGEEPYSIAMTAINTFDIWNPPVRILATDLDSQVIRLAAQGVYHLDRVSKVPERDVKRFFLRGFGSNAGMVRMRPEVRRLVTFRTLNLLGAAWPLKGPFDVIFCRNVLIYFDKPTQYRLMQRFHQLMTPDSLLFVGHSESLAHATDLFRLKGKTIYEPVRRSQSL